VADHQPPTGPARAALWSAVGGRFRSVRALLSPTAGVALVLTTPGGRTVTVWPDRKLSALRSLLGQVMVGRFRNTYRVGVWRRTAVFSVEMISADTGTPIVAEVELIWWVHDPATVVRRLSRDPVAIVRRDLHERVRKVTREHPVTDAATAEQLLDDSLGGRRALEDEGVTYGYGRASIAIDESAREQADEMERLRRETQLEETRQQVETDRFEYFRQLVSGGEDELFAYWLMQRPEDLPKVVEMIAERRAAEEARLAETRSAGQPSAEYVRYEAEREMGPEADFDRGLAALFSGLEGFERHEVRKAVVDALVRCGRYDIAQALVEGDYTHRRAVEGTSPTSGAAPTSGMPTSGMPTSGTPTSGTGGAAPTSGPGATGPTSGAGPTSAPPVRGPFDEPPHSRPGQPRGPFEEPVSPRPGAGRGPFGDAPDDDAGLEGNGDTVRT
jgi:hypothetical protein